MAIQRNLSSLRSCASALPQFESFNLKQKANPARQHVRYSTRTTHALALRSSLHAARSIFRCAVALGALHRCPRQRGEQLQHGVAARAMETADLDGSGR
eukprot:scaffold4656_cov95-Pinguiococcus_pyrenoidosus.AAC.1